MQNINPAIISEVKIISFNALARVLANLTVLDIGLITTSEIG